MDNPHNFLSYMIFSTALNLALLEREFSAASVGDAISGFLVKILTSEILSH